MVTQLSAEQPFVGSNPIRASKVFVEFKNNKMKEKEKRDIEKIIKTNMNFGIEAGEAFLRPVVKSLSETGVFFLHTKRTKMKK